MQIINPMVTFFMGIITILFLYLIIVFTPIFQKFPRLYDSYSKFVLDPLPPNI